MVCKNWTIEINDTGLIDEEALVTKFQPQGIQIQTKAVQAKKSQNNIELFSETIGASIGYKIVKDGIDPEDKVWMIYSEPVILNSGEKLVAIAHRIGYLPSGILKYNLP